VREKEQSVGKKKKKKVANRVARAPCARIREKRGDPVLTFVSERGPCAPVRKGEWSWGRGEKNKKSLLVGGEEWEKRVRSDRRGRVTSK
jgi:hypothetical protein